jgi:hypothetical protein
VESCFGGGGLLEAMKGGASRAESGGEQRSDYIGWVRKWLSNC